MMLRPTFAAVLALAALPAAASEPCAGDCYRPVSVPARYGVAVEPHVVRAPRTYALYRPAEYRTVYEEVVLEPGGRRWVVKRDASGRKVGCWIDVPARHATLPRQVIVRAASLEPVAIPTRWGFRERTFVAEPRHRAWIPIE